MLEKLKIKKTARVGILGGSFNPPHLGHLHISRCALQMLDLDYVVWLISPQNPNKSKSELKSFADRVAMAQAFVGNNTQILISDFEQSEEVNANLTFNTLTKIRDLYPRAYLVWLMGADNLDHFHEWGNWEGILRLMPVAVFDRNHFTPKIAECKLYNFVKEFFVTDEVIKKIPKKHIYFFKTPNMNISSTAIRKNEQWHNGAILDYTAPRGHAQFVERLCAEVVHSLDDDKAEDIVVLDLTGKADFAKYMIIATGSSSRHLGAMAENLHHHLRKSLGVGEMIRSGSNQTGWVAIDLFDIIVHLFRSEERERYALERMWDTEFDDV